MKKPINNKKINLDPITLEIMFNALRSVADETFVALMKSAYSTNIKERRDHSTAIIASRGRLIVQADASLPVHLASMGGLMEAVLKKFGNNIKPGDIFIANDPHVAGGTPLPCEVSARYYRSTEVTADYSFSLFAV